MDRQLIKEKIRTVIVAAVKHDNFVISEELSAVDVEGWDSLSHMIIIHGIEETFQIKFKLKELNKIINMGDLIELVVAKLKTTNNNVV